MQAQLSSFTPMNNKSPFSFKPLSQTDQLTDPSRVTPATIPLRTGFITPTPYKSEAAKDKSEAAKGSSSFNQFRAYQELDSDSEEELAGLVSTAPWTETFRESHVVKNLHQGTRTRQQSAALKSRGRDGDGGRDKKQNIDALQMHLMCDENFNAIDLS